MAEKLAQKPLLSRKEGHFCYGKKRPFLISLLLNVLKVLMWAIFIAWVSYIFMFASAFGKQLYFKSIRVSEGTLFGYTGMVFLIFSGPILLIAVLAVVYLVLRGEDVIQGMKTSKFPRFRLSTFPVLVDGPFGVVSAAEMIGIVLFMIYIIWAFSAETVNNIKTASLYHLPSNEQRVRMLELTALRLGLIGLFCLAFLFLPVARGSILLRLIDVPFEHAVRYHIWLGHLTMTLFTLHGLFYIVSWTLEGRLVQKLLEWKNEGVANLAGVISLVAGLLMWMTSLPGFRRKNFELFFYTHQLYVVFIVFLALHVGDFLFCYVAGGIFLFMLDRFLRYCQSRRKVDVVSAQSFPCGTMELTFPKPANLQFSALSWIFLQIHELSLLQWHPFSVSSSPQDGNHHFTILVKVLGDWTAKLERPISGSQPCPKITASVEGPYGHESPYHLMYENLVLVAGGIGISPFLAILSDILHRINDEKPCLPKNVLIIWAVKKYDEVSLLQTVKMETICPSFSNSLHLEIQTYITQESEPSLEEGKPIQPNATPATFCSTTNRGISVLVGTGNAIWAGIYTIVPTIGLIITVALLDAFYINPHNVKHWWLKGLLFVASMVISVMVFGGVVIGFWHLWEMKQKQSHSKSDIVQQNDTDTVKDQIKEQYINTIIYGKRPHFKDIFGSMSTRLGHVDIGVIVCGPASLRRSVAEECRCRNMSWRSNQAIFHYNSHSFDL